MENQLNMSTNGRKTRLTRAWKGLVRTFVLMILASGMAYTENQLPRHLYTLACSRESCDPLSNTALYNNSQIENINNFTYIYFGSHFKYINANIDIL